MRKINTLSNTITDSLYVKHQEIQKLGIIYFKLDIVNKDLLKLNNICEFP